MLKLQIEGFEELKKTYNPNLLEKTMAVSMQKTMFKTRTFVSKSVRERYVVKAGDIKATVKFTRPSRKPIIMQLAWRSKRTQLKDFKALPRTVRTARGKRKGVTVRVRKDRGRKLIRGAFFGPGGRAAYMRKGSRRHPIEKRTGIGIAQMVRTRYMEDKRDKFFAVEMQKQFKTNFDYFLKKQAGLL